MNAARRNLADSGSLLPVLFVEGPDSLIVGIGDMPSTSDQRQELLFELGRRLSALSPRKAILVFDAYMKVDEAGLKLPMKRSLIDDPAATECIVIGSLDRRGRSRVLVCPYERQPTLEGLRIEFADVRALPGQGQLYLLQAFFEGVRSR